MGEPWHFTTVVDLIDHWQALIAGTQSGQSHFMAAADIVRVPRGMSSIMQEAITVPLPVTQSPTAVTQSPATKPQAAAEPDESEPQVPTPRAQTHNQERNQNTGQA